MRGTGIPKLEREDLQQLALACVRSTQRSDVLTMVAALRSAERAPDVGSARRCLREALGAAMALHDHAGAMPLAVWINGVLGAGYLRQSKLRPSLTLILSYVDPQLPHNVALAARSEELRRFVVSLGAGAVAAVREYAGMRGLPEGAAFEALLREQMEADRYDATWALPAQSVVMRRTVWDEALGVYRVRLYLPQYAVDSLLLNEPRRLAPLVRWAQRSIGLALNRHGFGLGPEDVYGPSAADKLTAREREELALHQRLDSLVRRLEKGA